MHEYSSNRYSKENRFREDLRKEAGEGISWNRYYQNCGKLFHREYFDEKATKGYVLCLRDDPSLVLHESYSGKTYKIHETDKLSPDRILRFETRDAANLYLETHEELWNTRTSPTTLTDWKFRFIEPDTRSAQKKLADAIKEKITESPFKKKAEKQQKEAAKKLQKRINDYPVRDICTTRDLSKDLAEGAEYLFKGEERQNEATQLENLEQTMKGLAQVRTRSPKNITREEVR
jgi:hypothetical protein